MVVIEDDDHVLVQEACMVHGLIRHAACDGSVTDDGNAVVVPSLHTMYPMKTSEGKPDEVSNRLGPEELDMQACKPERKQLLEQLLENVRVSVSS